MEGKKTYISPDTRDYKEFDEGTKDMLCRIYKFITRHKGSITNVDFTEKGVATAYLRLNSTGVAGEGFCKRFIDNLDKLKELVELQTITHAVFYKKSFIKNLDTNEEYPYCDFEHHTYEAYDLKDVNYKIRNRISFRDNYSHSLTLRTENG